MWAIDLSNDLQREDCPAKQFIESLPLASQKSLAAVLAQHGDFGPLKNEQKSRYLEDGIYEFKNRQGARLFYFYARGGRTVITHGCMKPKKKALKTEIDRAKGLRTKWQEVSKE
ncbi:MAG: type II toxin-antitoxin system RelE/ParE family toxin [Chloroflexi bacterium]|nr:type II toxin-antitoxin system RelE/ParE family toxin [Chloroflexota bacterium]